MKTFISLKQTHPPKWSTWPPSKEKLSKLALATDFHVARICLHMGICARSLFFLVVSTVIIGRVSFIVAPCRPHNITHPGLVCVRVINWCLDRIIAANINQPNELLNAISSVCFSRNDTEKMELMVWRGELLLHSFFPYIMDSERFRESNCVFMQQPALASKLIF